LRDVWILRLVTHYLDGPVMFFLTRLSGEND